MEELMAKYLANELSEKERTDFELQLIQDEGFSMEFEACLNAWSLDETAQSPSFNTAAAWQTVSGQLLSEDKPVMQVSNRVNEKNQKSNTADVIDLKSTGHKGAKFSFLKIAATLLVLAVAGYFVVTSSGDNASGIEIAFTKASDNSFTLPDGTRVLLNADSKLNYDKNFGVNNRNVTLVGQADFDVTRDERLPFVIVAGQSKIEVLGTSFDIAAYPGKEAKLVVTEGTVAFASLNKASVKEVLTRGQQAVLDVAGEKMAVTQVVEDSFDNTWIREFQFEGAPLSEIFERIEKAYQVQITYPEGIKDCLWTMQNDKDDTVQQVFNLLELTFPTIKVSSEKENQIKLEGTACDN